MFTFNDILLDKKITHSTYPTSKSNVRTDFCYREVLLLNSLLFLLPVTVSTSIRYSARITSTVGLNSLPFATGLFLLSYILQSRVRNKIFRRILVSNCGSHVDHSPFITENFTPTKPEKFSCENDLPCFTAR
jgi:hypothetical protein